MNFFDALLSRDIGNTQKRNTGFNVGRSEMCAVRDLGCNFVQFMNRPVGMDGDVRPVVVDDGAGTVDDFLVARDLRHDLLLHLQRRQGDLEFGERWPADAWELRAFQMADNRIVEPASSEEVGVERWFYRSVDGPYNENVGRTNTLSVGEPNLVQIRPQLAVENVT